MFLNQILENLMKSILALLFLLSSTAVSSACLESSSDKIGVKFTAYKTPLKLGVAGNFTSLKLTKEAKGKTWKEATLNNTLIIDASKISTGDKSRDKKISKFFFENKKLDATITRISEKKKQLTLTVQMNSNTVKKIKMKYKFANNKLTAVGHIDALDFGMAKNLRAINKACLAKHEGKTWSDVQIELSAMYGNCK